MIIFFYYLLFLTFLIFGIFIFNFFFFIILIYATLVLNQRGEKMGGYSKNKFAYYEVGST